MAFFLSIFLSISTFFHPFYVSLTELAYNRQDKTLEVSVRIFTDDLEETIRLQHPGKKVDVLKPVNAAEMNGWINAYVQQHLQVSGDGKPMTLNWVGYEQQAESVWIYLETQPGLASPRKLDVANTLLYDFKKDQINLVRAKINGQEKNHRLSLPETRIGFQF